MQQNYRNRPVLVIGLAILFLIILSFIPGGLHIGPFQLKPIDLFIDIKPDSLISYNNNPAAGNSLSKSFHTQVFAGKLNLELLKKAVLMKGKEAETAYPVSMPITGNTANLKYFFDALKDSKNKSVRIAHYGDSEIEGDLITADFRQNLQEKFGGMGAGFLSITSQDIAFRTSTKHTFSNTWNTISVFNGNTNKTPIGIDGSVAIPKGKSWVQYETTGRYKNLRSFNKVKVFYYNAKASSSITYSFDNKKETNVSLAGGNFVHEVVLTPGNEAKNFRFTAQEGSADFLGVSLESGNGVYVDNFPLRGNSGVSLRDFSPQMLRDFNKLLSYKLIILSFGLNIASSNLTDYTWYEKEMIKAVNLLKSSFPQASILIVSVGDKGIKKGSSFTTDPNIPKLVQAQKNIAARSGVAFWNLYEAMGGENSMARWVNASPPLAFKDYTHVNLLGAEKIADMLTQALMDEFKKY